jgi:hypothetical protein
MKKLIALALAVVVSAWAIPAMSGGTSFKNKKKESEVAAENARHSEQRAAESKAKIERMEAETRAINEGRAVLHDGDSDHGYQDGAQGDGTVINGEWDTRGRHYSPAGDGNVWRDDGTFMQKAAGGYIDTKTGEFVPSN